MSIKKTTVAQYILDRFNDLNISDIFGVPGDVVYPFLDAVCDDERFKWVGNCNELNASYAADGYARMKGASAFCSTYGAGELSAVNGVAGAFAEFSKVFHVVGMPPAELEGVLIHHMLNRHSRDHYAKMMEGIYCASTVISAENCVAEMDRVIAIAKHRNRPVYIGIPADVTNQPVVLNANIKESVKALVPVTNAKNLDAVVTEIMSRISKAERPILFPGIFLKRKGLQAPLQKLIDTKKIPYATGLQDKSVCDETSDNYVGMYVGLIQSHETREYVEQTDCPIILGAINNIFNRAFFTINFDEEKLINIRPHKVQIGDTIYDNVEIEDVINALQACLPDLSGTPRMQAKELNDADSNELPDDKISGGEPLFNRISNFLREDDIVIGDPGGSAFGLAGMKLPKGAVLEAQMQWGSIGWGTPTAFGAAIAKPNNRVIMVGGEGAHQLTGQEVGQFYANNLKPVFIVINNDGYLVERWTCRNPEESYNDIPKWKYQQLPKVLGCEDWLTTKVTTNAELDKALADAQNADAGVYIEVITDRYSMPPGAEFMFNATRAKFGQTNTWKEWKAGYDNAQK